MYTYIPVRTNNNRTKNKSHRHATKSCVNTPHHTWPHSSTYATNMSEDTFFCISSIFKHPTKHRPISCPLVSTPSLVLKKKHQTTADGVLQIYLALFAIFQWRTFFGVSNWTDFIPVSSTSIPISSSPSSQPRLDMVAGVLCVVCCVCVEPKK